MNTQISISIASAIDIATLRDFAEKTFRDSYSKNNNPESMNKYISKNFNLAKMTTDFKNSNVIFLMVYANNNLTAYAKLVSNSTQPGIQAKKPIELEKIYIDKKSQGLGIGRMLINHISEKARKEGHDVLWLSVWDKNTSAMKFYDKLGFKKCGTHDFMLGDEAQIDFLYQITL